ncbi:MAG: bifunctional glycoside hydrolase 114/ polysaccharide deacetylase family protein [Burkholderiales bacterium]|nr:bifunctional glycoside hydrolase 114/ polysaccharide deacetylase family protein [Burkholderiales bacterium]
MHRRSFASALAAALLATLPHVAAASPSVAFFYGAQPPWDELAAFDAVVVEPAHVPAARAQAGPRTELFAYVSVGEIEKTRPYLAELPAAWRLGDNAPWESVVVDQSQPEWPAWLVERVVRPLWAAGYRGFFLDTLDSYQLHAKTDAARRAQEAGLVRAIRAIRAAFPEAKLFFNRGFEVLPELNREVWAVAAESLFRGWDQANRAYREVPQADREWLLGQLERVRSEYRLPVVAIDYVPPGERVLARETAERIRALGIVPWVTNPALDMLGVGAVEVVPRRVLMLWNRAEPDETLMENRILRIAAMPLEHLGLVPAYYEVNEDPLPAHVLAGRYAGVVTWFAADRVTRGAEFGALLARAVAEGVPVAMLGDLPVSADDAARLFGLRVASGPIGGRGVRVLARDAAVGFEVPAQPDTREFQPVAAPGADVLLRLADERGRTMDAVAIARWGGYALSPNDVLLLPGDRGARWVVDPFAFFKRALALPVFPVPDVTTENGRRLLLVHMDGDGFANRAELPGAPLASEVMLKEVLARFRVPTTVSVIEGEVSPKGLYGELAPAMEAIARRMFALPHVEIASHSWSHPFRWRRVEGADPDAAGQYALALPGYGFDLEREVKGSVEYIDRVLAPPGKKTAVFLWTGDTDPSAAVVEYVDGLGLVNMNGGDTWITRAEPSLTLVAPRGIPKGASYQVFAPNQNENVYTGNWTGPFYGFERVIETFELTESPRRLKPVNIYFHTYAASKRASLAALQKVFRWAQAQPLNPVFASRYARIVLDANRAAVARTPEGWLVRTRGEARTVRVPASAGYPALAGAAGVAGYARANGDHYIHLAGAEARFALAPEPPAGPYLASANGHITAWARDADGFTLELVAAVAPSLTLRDGARCAVRSRGRAVPARPAAAGLTDFAVSGDGGATVTVRCRA